MARKPINVENNLGETRGKRVRLAKKLGKLD